MIAHHVNAAISDPLTQNASQTRTRQQPRCCPPPSR